MNILIVDDLISVVNGIIKGVDWDSLGILGIYKAHNVYEARVLINNLKIDILLTDIEMPGESGLDLVEWIREKELDMECIFMSSHADFEYAQRALHFGGFRYVLLPCPYSEIQEVIRDAMEKLKKDRSRRKLSEYGKIISEDVWIEKMLLEECLDAQKNVRAVEKLVELKRFSRDTQGYLCYLKIRNEEDVEEKWDLQLMEFTLNNVISELMAPLQQRLLLFQKNIREYWFFCDGIDSNYTAPVELFGRQIQMVIETLRGICRLDTRIIYRYCDDLIKIAALSREILEDVPNNEADLLLCPDVTENRWLQYYNTEWAGKLKENVALFLEKKNGDDRRKFLRICMQLHTDLIQLLYKYLNQYNDSIFSVFETNGMFERYINAYKNVDDLLWMAEMIQNYIMRRSIPPGTSEDPVQEVTRYVHEHISQDIKRSDLANHVHLNIDYLSRIFKREKGVTLNDYIILEKMNVARNLLSTTRLPVSLIAVKVGYSNFSYFSKLYKKIYGHSPVQERR
ncbi:two-component system response regulator YesN [Catenibacillus scindens]|uniref:Stage 0 sporulation protein A homolog n=1 Tax=Catenibacillus scindens TaxID=673271 RepID=A0A7W8HCY9_9FIRM|nr:helix-turn-helix domain-containing protein [Catenibacillus scindens]MBB5266044.1 two-component system response regulator YesN [Catenibacillus scindens]